MSNLFTSWIPENEDYMQISHFFLSSYRIEDEFIKYLSYVPLKKNHFEVSSGRLVEFIYQTFPLLILGFDSLTFGQIMHYYLKRNIPLHFNKDNTLYEVYELLRKLYKSRKKNRIEIQHYYNFHNKDIEKIGFWKTTKTLSLRKIVGLIEFDDLIYPLSNDNFQHLKDVRNSVLKRRKLECTLYDVIQGIGLLAVIRERLTAGYYRKSMNYLNQGSKIFDISKTLKSH